MISPLTALPLSYQTGYSPMAGTGPIDWIRNLGNSIKNKALQADSYLQRTRIGSKVTGLAGDLTGNKQLKQASQYLAKNGYNANMAPMLVVRRKRKPGPKKAGPKKAGPKKAGPKKRKA